MVKKKILLGIVAAAVLVGLVGAVVVYNFGFHQRFEVVSAAKIRVFLGEGHTQELQQGNYLDWGQITDTDPKQKSLYIYNSGTVNAILGFGYDGQQMPQGWSLTWDYDNAPVASGATILVNMTLTMPSNIGEGTYECNSWINATPVS
jgi:hypothetical protein